MKPLDLARYMSASTKASGVSLRVRDKSTLRKIAHLLK